MNGNTRESQPHQPTSPSPTPKDTVPLHQPPSSSPSNTQETQSHQPGLSSSSAPPYDGSAEKPYQPSSPSPTAKDTVPLHQPPSSSPPITQETQSHQPGLSSSSPPPPPYDGSAEKWGTHIMGAPGVPTSHPDNQKAALWSAGDHNQSQHHPYLQETPVEKPSGSPMESVLHVFNTWGNKAETMANHLWQHLKTGPSVPGAAWGKVNLTAKAITGGGFEALYKQTFTTQPGEKLKRTFACYMSTSTGPVAGTLYLSSAHVAFCSDRPLTFPAPSGQETWSYYKVLVPLGKIGTINPVVMQENPKEHYIQIVTIDGHDSWFMGFVNYEKASRHLSESLSNFVESGTPVQPVAA